jgi:methylenetetrahydrofolate reductase (NADH)
MMKMRLLTFSTLNLVSAMTQSAPTAPTVVEMLRGYSIEVNPRQTKVVDAALSRLDRGTEVFLAWIPGSDPMDSVAPAARLSRAGLLPVPHIGARHLESRQQLQRLAARLAGEAGVDRILIIGGDRENPAGPYDSSLAVMQTGVIQQAGITRMAVAGFPEGNPNISEAALDEALAAKLKFAQVHGLQISIVTQFSFKAEPIIEWLRRMRNRGIDIPVRIGLAGPAGLMTLLRYALRCGIGNSLKVLTEHPTFAKLLTEKGPEPIIRELATSIRNNDGTPPLGIAGLHFYVFGGFNKTLDWIDAELTQ